ncbi:hypothetical protein ES703_104499 [subsurface metagenome]
MGKEGEHQGDKSATDRAKDKALADALESGGTPVWVREDGALCIGNECMVIKPREGSHDLDIEITPDRCGQAVAEIFGDTIYKTIGRGGATHFTVKSELEGKE